MKKVLNGVDPQRADLARGVRAEALHQSVPLLHSGSAVGERKAFHPFSVNSELLVQLVQPIGEGDILSFGDPGSLGEKARRDDRIFVVSVSPVEIAV